MGLDYTMNQNRPFGRTQRLPLLLFLSAPGIITITIDVVGARHYNFNYSQDF